MKYCDERDYCCDYIVRRIIELKNKNLIFYSMKHLCFFYKGNNEYKKDYSFVINNAYIFRVIQTKDNEICYNVEKNLCFYDLIQRKIITKIDYATPLNMMTKDLLLVAVENKLKIINVKLHNLIRIIDIPGSGAIYCICMLNDNMLLTADLYGRIIQWKIEGDNLKLFSKKELAHKGAICTLLKIGNGLILSGGNDVRIW